MKLSMLVVIIFLFATTLPIVAIAEPAKELPLERFLNGDGTLNLLAEGVPGSINPKAYRLINRHGMAQQFVPENRPVAVSAGDWDTQFSVTYPNNEVLALACDGNPNSFQTH